MHLAIGWLAAAHGSRPRLPIEGPNLGQKIRAVAGAGNKEAFVGNQGIDIRIGAIAKSTVEDLLPTCAIAALPDFGPGRLILGSGKQCVAHDRHGRNGHIVRVAESASDNPGPLHAIRAAPKLGAGVISVVVERSGVEIAAKGGKGEHGDVALAGQAAAHYLCRRDAVVAPDLRPQIIIARSNIQLVAENSHCRRSDVLWQVGRGGQVESARERTCPGESIIGP